MKIRFQTAGDQREAEVRGLTTLGAFVLSGDAAPPDDEAFELLAAGESIAPTGEVVRITDEGFAVAFNALPPHTLDKLSCAIAGEPLPAPTEDPPSAAPLPPPDQMPIAGLDWTPPVSEPVLHEWRPDTGFVIPLPSGSGAKQWAELPTITDQGAQPAEPQARMRIRPQPSPAAAPQAPPPQAAAPRATVPPAAAPPAPATEPRPEAQAVSADAVAGPAPSGPDQRSSERHDRSIPVSFDNLTGLIKEFTHNISYGGMFVYTSKPQEAHTDTAVTLIHPVHGERLTLLARVVHGSQAPSSDPRTGEMRYGLGLEFKLPLDELKRLLADFIGSHQKQEAPTPTAKIISEARAIMARGQASRFALLGVEEGAAAELVRRAYFKLVDRFHPDRYFGKVGKDDRKLLEELFRSLTKAYEELTV